MKRIELLSPAGSFDALKAAVNYGADAVYLGGTNFSARAFANNFDHEELIEAVKYCHLRGVKVYLTLNTLLNEDEIENAVKEAKFYYDNKVDALIIQDLGLYYRLKRELPDFDLHASTQMHIHNLAGVRNAKKLGFKKVVLARESDLELIKEACKEDIEIECFIHGAICVAYSGQCLMSSATKNRSANKGMCAQCCRLKYSFIDSDTNKRIETDTDYLLSPKDMFLLNDIPSLIEAGVSSLKIEGRLKSPAYVGLVTSLYRLAIDAYYKGDKFTLTKKKYDDLLSVFNRGFTNSYLNNSDSSIFHNKRPNHMGIEVGKVIHYNDGHCTIRLFKSINQFDGIRIINNFEDVGKILNTLTVNGKYVASANKDDIIEINIDSKVSKGDIVVKTLDSYLEQEINNYDLKRTNIDLNITFKENLPITIKCDINKHLFIKEYDVIPETALKAPITEETIIDSFSKFGIEPFKLNEIHIDLGYAFLPKSKINEVRRLFVDDLKEFILNSFKRENNQIFVFGDINVNNDFSQTLVEDLINTLNIKNKLIKDPVINTQGEYKHKEVVSEFGGLFNNIDNKTAYYTLNISNSYAYELLTRLGFNKIILSTELNSYQINRLIESFNKRNGIDIKPYVLIYGRRTLMYLKRNPIADYCFKGHKLMLSDGMNNYKYICNQGFNELIEENPHIITDLDLNIVNSFVIIDNNNDLNYLKKQVNLGL